MITIHRKWLVIFVGICEDANLLEPPSQAGSIGFMIRTRFELDAGFQQPCGFQKIEILPNLVLPTGTEVLTLTQW